MVALTCLWALQKENGCVWAGVPGRCTVYMVLMVVLCIMVMLDFAVNFTIVVGASAVSRRYAKAQLSASFNELVRLHLNCLTFIWRLLSMPLVM